MRYIADMSVEKWAKIAPFFKIRQLPNIVKSVSIFLYFVRTYYSESWIWSHIQNKTIVCSFSRKLRKKISCYKITSVCLSFSAKCLRCFTNALMTLRHYAFSRQHRTPFSEDVYAFVLWRCVAVQIWRVKELSVPGIVASTINRMWISDQVAQLVARLLRERTVWVWIPL